MKKQNITPYNDKNKAHGCWETYYSNGKVNYKGNYKNGVLHGYWIEYYFNGNTWYEGNFINGLHSGYWIEYDTDGTINRKQYIIL